jgi:hypothetical protein
MVATIGREISGGSSGVAHSQGVEAVVSDVEDEDSDQKPKPAPPEVADEQVDKRNKLLVDIWKQAVDTQKHFNEMSGKSRQLGLTFVAASLGAAVFLFTRVNTPSSYAFSATICGHEIIFHVAVFIMLAALAGVWAVRELDLGVYHQMLRGAVTFNEDLEEKHIRRIVGLEKGLTQAISFFSRNSDASRTLGPNGYIYAGDNHRTAGQKLSRFYTIVMVFLALSALAMFVASNLLKPVP